MKKIYMRLLAILYASLMPSMLFASSVIDFDVATGTYTGGTSDFGASDGVVSYVKNGCNASYGFNCEEAGSYQVNINFTWFKYEGDFTFTVTDKNSNNVEASGVYTITGKGPAVVPLKGRITTGEKTLTISVSTTAGGYVANYENFTMTIDGTASADDNIVIDVAQGVYEGGDTGKPFGATSGTVENVKNGCKATYTFDCINSGSYDIDINFTWFKYEGVFKFSVMDKTTGITEATADYTVTGTGNKIIGLDGTLTSGEKLLTIEISSTAGGFIANYPSFTLVRRQGVTGLHKIDIDNSDLPVEYYNLQGIRIFRPNNGIFIRRQGSKVEKIIIRD